MHIATGFMKGIIVFSEQKNIFDSTASSGDINQAGSCPEPSVAIRLAQAPLDDELREVAILGYN